MCSGPIIQTDHIAIKGAKYTAVGILGTGLATASYIVAAAAIITLAVSAVILFRPKKKTWRN